LSTDHRELHAVGAALQAQLAGDFGPIWNVNATIDVFNDLVDIPLGYWPLVVVDDAARVDGIHLDAHGRPFALVESGASWSLAASQSALHLATNAFGNRFVVAESTTAEAGSVEYLLEVCEPCRDARYAYRINGMLVSDFHVPDFHQVQGLGGRYSFSGSLERPQQVLPGGTLTWRKGCRGGWQQLTFTGAYPEVRDLESPPAHFSDGIFQWLAKERVRGSLSHLATDAPALALSQTKRAVDAVSSARLAVELRDRIDALRGCGEL
jgi:hypothetical protein